jgi:hypothetical protein
MTRQFRILFEVFGPPFVGAILGSLFAFVMNAHAGNIQPIDYFITVPLSFVVGAYYLMTIPSVGFAAAMEMAFLFGLRITSWITVVLTSLIGLLAGVLLGKKCEPSTQAVAVGIFSGHPVFCFYALIGLTTGLIMGCIIRAYPQQMPNQSTDPTPASGTPPAGQESRHP